MGCKPIRKFFVQPTALGPRGNLDSWTVSPHQIRDIGSQQLEGELGMAQLNRLRKENPKILPNLVDYQAYCQNFSWEKAKVELLRGGDPTGLNIGSVAVDQPCEKGLADHIALHCWGIDRKRRSFSFNDLKKRSNQFARVLQANGVNPSDRVFALTGRGPEIFIAALGTWKNKSLFCPLFSAFGPEPLFQRLSIGEAQVLVTTESLFQKKVQLIRERLPQLRLIFVIGPNQLEGTKNFYECLDREPSTFTVPATSPHDPAILHFTSGTTGRPKAVVHAHEAVVAHYWTGRLALDFHSEDIFWCTADPGWVTGTSYGIISPLTNGLTSVIDEADFDLEHWYEILQNEKVTVWYTAPTALRMMMKAGPQVRKRYDLSALRFIASVGEPLNPEVVRWGQEVLGLPIHDNWWQTETGGIMIANFQSQDIKPGSMGRPLPGIHAQIVRKNSSSGIEFLNAPRTTGELALEVGWPSQFRAYRGEEERYRKSFSNGYYLTGDLVRQDEDGYFWFIGRADDLIKSAGHLLGPFEIESVLMEHPAVAEAAVIGKPDPVVNEIVKAFVALKNDFHSSPELILEIMALARKKLGSTMAPKELTILPNLPKTRSGKLMRRLLKARELGLPEGDLSTLEKE
jgi:acetyl-CoA synthetase